MSFAFDGRALGQVLVDTERLTERARDHESRLARLIASVEDYGAGVRDQMLDELRQLCAAAREQRTQAEAMMARLVGMPSANRVLPFVEQNDGLAAGARVLVVDDSLEVREFAAGVVEKAGLSAITAANGLEALMVAHYARPAVVLMDINMPVLDGIEAARLMKASPATRLVQIIAHTAWPSFYDGPLKSVFDGFLLKPASTEDLVAAIRRAIGDAPPKADAAGG
jgi:two-component system cell cycle response regulator DivK